MAVAENQHNAIYNLNTSPMCLSVDGNGDVNIPIGSNWNFTARRATVSVPGLGVPDCEVSTSPNNVINQTPTAGSVTTGGTNADVLIASNQGTSTLTTVTKGIFCGNSGTSTVSNTNNFAVVAAQNSSMTGSSQCLMSGSGNTITSSQNSVGLGTGSVISGFNNALAWSATATANDQITLGAGVNITNSKNIDVVGGQVRCLSGLVIPEQASLGSSTQIHGAYVIAGSAQTLPTVANMNAVTPSNSTRLLFVRKGTDSLKTDLVAPTTSFRGKAGLDKLPFQHYGVTHGIFFNSRLNSYDFLGVFSSSGLYRMTQVNRFGGTPPATDASDLVTSTSRANHESNTTVGARVGWNTFPGLSPILPDGVGTGSNNIRFQVQGLYIMQYSIRITGGSVSTGFTLRADFNVDDALVSAPGSYCEITHAQSATTVRTCTFSSPVFVYNKNGSAAVNHYLRLTQDATDGIAATYDIEEITLFVRGEV